MGQSSSKKKYVLEEEIDSYLEISKIEPYSDWLKYLKKWISVDSKHNKDEMLNLVSNDIKYNETQNYNDFITRYMPISDNLGILGKCAFEVTKTNFLLWNNGIPPNIK